MGVPPLRLLLTTAALVVGAACTPALGAQAAPEHVAVHGDRAITATTQREPVLDSAAQRVSDTDGRAVLPVPQPPLWLLVLLVPILVGGAVGTGVTLRRLR